MRSSTASSLSLLWLSSSLSGVLPQLFNLRAVCLSSSRHAGTTPNPISVASLSFPPPPPLCLRPRTILETERRQKRGGPRACRRSLLKAASQPDANEGDMREAVCGSRGWERGSGAACRQREDREADQTVVLCYSIYICCTLVQRLLYCQYCIVIVLTVLVHEAPTRQGMRVGMTF